MTIATPLRLRWERAQQIDPSRIEEMGQGWYVVPSSRNPTGYAVHIEFDPHGKLTTASCTCPDFEKRTEGLGMPSLRGLRVCKHVLAASMKARDVHLPTTDRQPACPDPVSNTLAQDTEHVPSVTATVVTACEPVWDPESEEWVLTDAEGVHHCGAAPSECICQFEEAEHYRADHARKNGDRLAESSAPQPQSTAVIEGQAPETVDQMKPADAPLNEKRPQALSRARGIANQARPPLGPSYRLYGINQGDVLDWSDHGMFLAVVSTTYESLVAQGVRQDDPWGEVRDICMTAEVLHLRLENGWLSKVRRPCR